MPPRRDPDVFKEMHFPLAGIDLSTSFDNQPVRPMPNGEYARTTSLGINVRTFEPLTGTARGGQRPGILQYISGQVAGAQAIQDISLVATVSPTARGAGGGFQPNPMPSSVLSFTLLVGYQWTLAIGLQQGFRLGTRLYGSAPLARTALVTPNLNILGHLAPPNGEYTNNQNGYSLKLSVADSAGQVVPINGQLAILQQLGINSNGTLSYLGTAIQTYLWTNRTGMITYIVTVALLDGSGNPVPSLDSLGIPTGANVQASFSETVTI